MLAEEVFDFFLTVDTTEELLDLDLTLKLHKSIEHSFRPWRTPRDININRKYLVDSVYNAIRFFKRSTTNCATAARDYVLRFGELVVETDECRSHFVDDCALHHDIVSLTRGVTSNLESETSHVIAGSTQTHEFDGAAACAETEWPKGVGNTPIDQLVEFADCYVGAGGVEFFYEFFDVFIVFEVVSLH